MADEAVHEIHLNGKQLVFMFMATTVVAVVIFLSGVMVGRGVPPRIVSGDRSASATGVGADPTAPPDAAALAEGGAGAARATGSATGTSGVPVTTQETLTYAERLQAPTPPRETLKEIGDASRSGTAAAVDPLAAKPAPRQVTETPARAAPADPVASAAATEPAGAGWAVQVMAVPASQRVDADALARRLAAKGYPAYVVPRGNRFAVRVGKYPNQREAEAISARLKKEEQFDPWVTR